ncbi:hypothetical protein [Frigoribacterium sp. Leaf186]|uniref:hypothetical protein n=1 Tax=Frigoribacterium sp. Leaf186 TaxID=1736293 RepID=UPI000A4C2810|nr:hypothetical protein [Frigoribacterium sp. Leaf186]
MTVDLTASFVMTLPPGWVRLPARPEAAVHLAHELDAIVAAALPDDLPRDSAEPLRRQFRRQLARTVAEAGEAGATAVYLPGRPVDGYTLPASLTEAEVDDESDAEPVEVIARLLVDAGQLDGGLRDVDGAAAARTEDVLTNDEPEGSWERVWTRRVVYTISVPHRPGRWLVLNFSAVYGDEPSERLAAALVQLFDALVTTFRWIDVPGAEPGDLETRLAEVDA